MSRGLIEHFIRNAIDWFFRVSAVERWLITSAFGVIVAVFAGPPLVGIVLGLIFEAVPEEYLTAVRVVNDVDLWILVICGIVILAALSIVVWRLFVENRSNSRKRVLVVEGRGLRDDDGSPLVEAIPKSILAQQFLEVVKKVRARGVRRIHLVMAAPNSVVFTFGRRYDKRNLPEIVVYQYERGQSPAYPWGVLMPVGGVSKPSIIYNASGNRAREI